MVRRFSGGKTKSLCTDQFYDDFITQATYNLSNSPHLRPAFIFDRVVKRLARDIGEGAWVERDIPRVSGLIKLDAVLTIIRLNPGRDLHC